MDRFLPHLSLITLVNTFLHFYNAHFPPCSVFRSVRGAHKIFLGILSATTFGKGFSKAGLQRENDIASHEDGKETEADFAGSCKA